MNSDDLPAVWDAYRSGEYRSVRTSGVESPLALFYRAVLASSEGEQRDAAALARAAADLDPGDLVFDEAARWLGRPTTQHDADVYEGGEAFAAFVRGGSNVALYEATSDRLRRTYAEYESLALLDIGVGDGLALLPALSERVAHVDVIEPSAALLAMTTAALHKRGTPHRAFCATFEEFVAAPPTAPAWDLAQATFALQTVPPDQRRSALRWLAARAPRLVLMEFDVPRFDGLCTPARVQYVVERYRRGIAEYFEDRDLVVQGFLMPMLFGYFDRSAIAANDEQPIDTWADELRAAGYTHVETQQLYRYWWADAYVVEARTSGDT